MDPMMKVINALSALVETLQELKATTTDKYLATFETIYDPAIDDIQEAPAPAVTFEQLRCALAAKSREGHSAEIKALIQKYGAEKLSEVAKDKYAELLAEAEVL